MLCIVAICELITLRRDLFCVVRVAGSPIARTAIVTVLVSPAVIIVELRLIEAPATPLTIKSAPLIRI